MNILNSVIIIFLMMGTGYFLAKKELLNENTNVLFGKLIIKITLPSTVMVAFINRFTKADIIDSLYKLVLCYMMIFSFILIGILMNKIFKVSIDRKVAVTNMTMFSNTLFIGIPVNYTIFGEESLPYLFIFWFASFSLFWTLGIYTFTRGEERFSLKNSVKNLLTPPLISFVISMIFIIFEIPLPEAIKVTLQKFGGMTTPLAMLFLGTVIQNLELKDFKIDKDVLAVLISRFLLAPLLAIIYIYIAKNFIHIEPLAKKVFVMTASLPIMTNLAIVSKYYKKDYKFTSMMVGMTTIIGLLTIPIWAYILNYIY